MAHWAAMNGMALHPEKTVVVHFGHNNPCHSYTLCGAAVTSAGCVKDLGVQINTNCTPSDHVIKITKKANSVLGQLQRATVSRSKEMVIGFYKTYVRPLLESSVQAWNPWLKRDVEAIKKIQRRATKLVSGIGSLPYGERLKKCGLTSLEDRRKRGDAIECFKILNGFVEYGGVDFFSLARDRHSLNTRNAAEGLLVPEKTSLEIRRNFFTCRVVNSWNELPIEIRTASSVNSFKNKYDLYFKTSTE